MIATVLFDMNDVLFRYDRRVCAARLAALCRLSQTEVEAAIWGSGYEDSGDRGQMDADAYLAGFGERLGRNLTANEWAEALRAAVTPMPDTLALAAALAERAQVAVLTNNNLLVKRALDVVFPELCPIFGANVFVSAEFGVRKPEPEAFRGLPRMPRAACRRPRGDAFRRRQRPQCRRCRTGGPRGPSFSRLRWAHCCAGRGRPAGGMNRRPSWVAPRLVDYFSQLI